MFDVPALRPMVVVVAAVVLLRSLPLGDAHVLVHGEDALLELDVVVDAAVTLVWGHEHSILFLARMHFGVEDIVWHASAEVDEGH